MSNMPISPKAKKFMKENGIDPKSVLPTGKDGDIRYITYSDVKDIPKITPLAKKIAEKNNIDINKVSHSERRISRDDVLKYAQSIDGEKAFTLNSARLKIAQNLTSGIMETIPYTLFAKIDTTKAYEYYEKVKGASSVKISFTDVITLAISKALKNNILINTTRKDGYYISEDDVNISLAVDNDGIILTPVIKNAGNLTLGEMARKRVFLLDLIKSGKLTSEYLEGGTFTVSNLGKGSVTHFTPVINYPQSGIMGVGRTEDELYMDNSQIKSRKITYFSLTVDHAIIDGKIASVFLEDMQDILNDIALTEV